MKSSNSKRRVSAIVSFVVAITMFVSMFTACGSKSAEADKDQTSSGSQSTNAETSTVVDTSKENGVLPIVKDPITLSIFITSRQPDALYTSDTLTLKELSKRTNIKFDINTVVQSQSGQKFKLLMASGNLPDIVRGSVDDINKYGIMGAFQELDESISKNAPNVQKYLVDDKTAHAQAASANGKLYAVPMLSAVRTAMGYCIRQDWLDKLGLKAPVTIDDWYTVLKAFKEGDPNGNKLADEVPLILDKAWENYYMNFLDAWKIEADPNKDYWTIKDNQVVFSVIQPEFKDYLATMAKWYSEKLIDQEFITREDTNNYHVLNNLAGASCYWTGYLAAQNANKDVLAKDPKTNWQVIAPPVLNAGDPQKTFSQQNIVVPHAWAISASNKHPVETMKLFDYVYSDEGSLLFNFGMENDSYTMVDGKPHYTDKVKNDKDGLMIWMRKNGLQPLIGIRQMKEYEADSCATDDIRKQLFDYVDNDRFFDPIPPLSLTEAEKDVYTPKMSPILTYVEERIAKFMTGAEPISKFDEFVTKIKELGIDDLTKLKEQSYERYKKIAQ